MGVTAPAVFRGSGRVVLGEVIGWHGDWLARLDIAEIFLGQRVRVIFDMVEHVERAVTRVVKQAQPGLI